MATRADLITQTVKKGEVYSDFTTNFQKHPITNELIVVKNEDSVKQAFKNLILTVIGERLFDPFFGTDVNKATFEPYFPFAVEDIRRYVNLAAAMFEDRINVLNISVLDNSDKNGLTINIVFALINNSEPIKLSLFLKRVR